MTMNSAKEYFSKLLNTTVDENTFIRLSSGQSARAHAWLKSNNLNVEILSIGSGFTLRQLIVDVSSESINLKTSSPEIKNVSSGFHKQRNSAFGIDIQSIGELFPSGLPMDPKSDNELLEMFTIKELSYAQSKGQPLQTLTGIFAAKEAVQKCTQKKFNFTDIEILPDENGKPCTNGFLISISHSQDYVVAIAMIQEEDFYTHTALGQDLSKSDSITIPNFKDSHNNSIRRLIMPSVVSILLLLELIRIFTIIKW